MTMINNLNDTASLMASCDYKERFKAEYFQLRIRLLKLNDVLVKAANGTLDFEPSCPIDLLSEQFKCMEKYKHILEKRAQIENIILSEDRPLTRTTNES